MRTIGYIYLILLWLSATVTALGQTPGGQPPKDSVKAKKVEFINADYAEYVSDMVDAMRIIGRVALRHEGVMMYADSAYRYMSRNAFDAFGRIHIIQGDSIDLYGDTLRYDGETGLATLLGRVRMKDPQVNLETKYITYDIRNKVATYPDSAVTRSQDNNILKSKRGSYYANEKKFVFTKNVTIDNPKYTVRSDTMHFTTDTEVAYFYGPTTIVSKENTIKCSLGWYDTKRDICSFSKNAEMDAGAQNLKADTIYYERKTGYGLAKKNVILTDTVEKTIVMGHYAESYEKKDEFTVTDSVTLIMISGGDSLFLSADTLFAYKDSICDRIMKAYHHVKFYRADMQGGCDSLAYIRGDSLIQMFHAPILWNEENQLTAKFMQFMMSDGKINSLDMVETSMIIAEEDTLRYNQISGVNMRGWFKDNALTKVDVYLNGQTIYYPREDSGAVIGMNRVDCRDITIHMEDRKIDRIVFKTEPKGELTPDDKVVTEQRRLPGFTWLDEIRPKSLADIYAPRKKVKQKSIPKAEPEKEAKKKAVATTKTAKKT